MRMGNNILQGIGRQIDINRLFQKTAARLYPLKCTFQFAHIGADVFGNKKRGLLIQAYAGNIGFFLQNRHPHFQFRRFKL